MIMRSARTFINELLGGGRPRPFRARAKDVARLRAAITLRAARPGDDVPSEEFVTDLRRRLSAAQSEQGAPAEPPTSRNGTRRRFVQATSVAAGAAAVAGAGIDHLWARGGDAGKSATTAAGGTLEPNTGTWVPVASSADLPENGIHGFDVGTVIGFVQRRGGRLRAVSGVCTHQGCRLALDAAVRELKCPCHRSVFAVTGEVVRSQLRQPPRTLPELQVREASGVIEVYAPPG